MISNDTITKDDIKDAFRKLPHQGHGTYRLDNCSHKHMISLKSSKPDARSQVCPGCLARFLKGGNQ